MKLNKEGYTEFFIYPENEMATIIKTMKTASKRGDLAALQRCVKQLMFLHKIFHADKLESNIPFFDDKWNLGRFNEEWEKQ